MYFFFMIIFIQRLLHQLIDIPEELVTTEAINAGRRTDQRSYKVEGLIPNSGYRFRVRALNNLGRGEEASTPSGKQTISSYYNHATSRLARGSS